MKRFFSAIARIYTVLAGFFLAASVPMASAQYTVTVPWPDGAVPESNLFSLGWVIREINTNPWSPATINFAIPGAPDITGTWHMTNHQKTVYIDGATGVGRINGTLIFAGRTIATGLDIGTNSFFSVGALSEISNCWFREASTCVVGSNSVVGEMNYFWNDSTLSLGSGTEMTATNNGFAGSNLVQIASHCDVRHLNGDIEMQIDGASNVVKSCRVRRLIVNGNENQIEELVARDGGLFHGIVISGSGNRLKGGETYGHISGIYITGASNKVTGFRVGYSQQGWDGPNDYGIVVEGDGNQIGDTADSERNWIINSRYDGIKVSGGDRNRLWNNFIGLRDDGVVKSNAWAGIRIESSAGPSFIDGLEIGGDADYKGNTIVGNGRGGIYGWDWPFAARDIVIRNNRIGVRQPLFFSGSGIGIGNGSGSDANGIRLQSVDGLHISNNWVGAHDYYGIFLQECTNVAIGGNRIGTDGDATTNYMPNKAAGVRLRNCNRVEVGGTNQIDRNIISGNANSFREGIGLYVDGQSTTNVVVKRNLIGVNAAETDVLRNGRYGILLSDTRNVTVGGETASAGNVIGGASNGVYFSEGSQCIVIGNSIGVGSDGTTILSNTYGVVINGGSSNRIGGAGMAGNVIAGNQLDGIWVASGTRNSICGNRIGVNRDGIPIGNRRHGVLLGDYLFVNVNFLGGGTNEFGEPLGNIIAGNASNGVRISGSYTSWNYLDGNRIHSNAHDGVYISCNDNYLGMTNANYVFGNGRCGVYLTNCQYNIFRNNRIGLTPGGELVGNNGPGILLDTLANINTVGNVLTNGNIIVVGDSTNYAVWIRGSRNNFVQGNFLGGLNSASIRIEDTSTGNTIGGDTNEANIIAGAAVGVELVQASSQVINGNWIGFIPDHAVLPPTVTNFYAPHRLSVGIRVADGRHNNITGNGSFGNSIGGVQQAGILLESSGAPTLCASNVINMTRIGCPRQPIANSFVTNAGDGVVISNAGWNTVGATWATNFISGNRVGMVLYNAVSNVIQNNSFGLTDNGFFLPNRQVGILAVRARGDIIGGSFTGTRGNRIVGTGYTAGMTNVAPQGDGILLINCIWTAIQGNEIGWDRSIGAALPNARHGICVSHSTNILIGGSSSFRNYIGGNLGHGIVVTGKASTLSATICGNRVGLAIDNVTPAPNGGSGIVLDSTRGNVIGGGTLDLRNIVSANAGDGIRIVGEDSEANQVIGNFIGTDGAGVAPRGNGGNGIAIENSPRNMIVSTGAAPNLIAASGLSGILISGPGSVENHVAGSWIGIGTNGNPTGNFEHGIKIWNASDNVISNNLVVANQQHGVFLGGENDMWTRFNVVVNNSIGATPAGVPMANRRSGVRIERASRNTIGPGNIVCANGQGGIAVESAFSFDNEIVGNSVGYHPLAPGPAMQNGGSGILLNGGGGNRVGGTNTWQANVAAYNTLWGVQVAQGRGNHVLGNSIYSNKFRGIRLGVHATPYPLEDDQSPNRSQRAPRITQATLGSLTVAGTLDSGASKPYLLEFFLSPSNAAMRAEGQWLLGRTNIFTDGGGHADFMITFSGGVAEMAATGMFVTATATDTNGNTSAFSTPWIIGYGAPAYVTNAPVDVPVSWLNSYGITNDLEQANLADLDGDGIPTWQEYVMDADPTHGDSYLRQTAITAPTTAGLVIQWPASPERLYNVYWISDLMGGFPVALADYLRPTAYGVLSYTDNVHHAEMKSFYGIRALLP